MSKTFKWTVEFEVTENWVADGFEMTDESATELLQHALPYAYESELKAKVLTSPSVNDILVAQGYAVDGSSKTE